MVTNTWFQHPYRRRYTWKKPGDTGRCQIDYILVKQRYSNSIKNSCSYPGADCNSDHNLVAVRVRIQLKRLKKAVRQGKWNLDQFKLREEEFERCRSKNQVADRVYTGGEMERNERNCDGKCK